MILSGGCFCGRVRYEAAATPRNVTVCHCDDCRRATGSPMVGWMTVRPEDLRYLVEVPRHFASSPGVTRSFCAGCGTPLTYRRAGLDEVDITICTLDDPEAVVPADHVWTSRQLRWAPRAQDVPRHSRSRPDAPEPEGRDVPSKP